jgi:competence protein ComEA
MFKLERAEVFLIVFMSAALLAGLCVAIHKKSNSAVMVKVERFDLDSVIEGSDDCRRWKSTEKISINHAGVEDLVKLKGIGITLANRIIDYRSQHGYFFSSDDIKNVKGIGPGLFSRIRDEVIVE